MSFQAKQDSCRSAVAEDGSPIFAEDAGLMCRFGTRVMTGSKLASVASAMKPTYKGNAGDHAIAVVVPKRLTSISETVSVSLAVILCNAIRPIVALDGITTYPGFVADKAVPSAPANVNVPAACVNDKFQNQQLFPCCIQDVRRFGSADAAPTSN